MSDGEVEAWHQERKLARSFSLSRRLLARIERISYVMPKVFAMMTVTGGRSGLEGGGVGGREVRGAGGAAEVAVRPPKIGNEPLLRVSARPVHVSCVAGWGGVRRAAG